MKSIQRKFRSLSFKGAHYRFSTLHSLHSGAGHAAAPDLVPETVRKLRRELEKYIRAYPEFGRSLAPIGVLENPGADAPESARRMHRASLATLSEAATDENRAGGISPVGPMAAVAGTFAELAVEAVLDSFRESGGAPNRSSSAEGSGGPASESNSPDPEPNDPEPELTDVVVENGGDIAMHLAAPLYVGLYLGPDSPFAGLAFRIEPGSRIYAICSSSARMGHSLSFGSCDLATVFSRNAAVADAAATALCNSITSEREIERRLEAVLTIEEVDGAVAVYGKHMGRVGRVPEIVRHRDPDFVIKVSKDEKSSAEINSSGRKSSKERERG